MNNKYIVPSNYIIGSLNENQLDLSNLPEFPDMPKRSSQSPQYIGFVTAFKEDEGYGFIVTNGQGMDGTGHKTRIREVFFHINDWQVDKSFSVGDAVKFALQRKNNDRAKALNISLLDVSSETYNIGEKYIGDYSHVIGTVKRDYITKDFQKVIHDLFLSSEEGKAIVLRSLVEEMKANEEKSAKLYSLFIAKDSRLKELAKEAPVLLSSEEDLAILRTIYKAQFTNALQDYNADEFIESVSLLGFDECKNEMWAFINDKISSEKSKCVKFLDALPKETIEEYFTSDDYHPNAEVRQYLARKTQSISWLKHPCVISEWNASIAANKSLSSLFKEINSIGENVTNDFSLYIAECQISSDKLKWNTFLGNGIIDCYNKISDKQACVKTLEDFQPLIVKNFLQKIVEVMDNESDEFFELIGWIEEDTIAKGMKEMSSDEQYQFLQCIPDQMGIDIVYNLNNS